VTGKPVHGHEPNYFKSGGELDEIKFEINRTNQLINDVLGMQCEGMTSPWGYYRGLVDRPDVLRILDDNGIQWIRSNARDFMDCQPTPFEEQPFFYADQGFPEILELDVQGYKDDFYWERFDDRRYRDNYEDYLYAMLSQVAENGWIWNICSHGHQTATAEIFDATRGKWLRALMERAMDADIRFLSPVQLYNEMRN
jgi:hypothetical protein